MHKAVLYEKLEEKKVRCLACRHKCVISHNSTGICGVRFNKDGGLYLLVYGRASGVNIDPVEKKPLYHFLPGSPVFSLGTVGCNFGCDFCQNWETSQASKEIKPENRLAEVPLLGDNLPPKEIVSQCIAKNIPSIAYTYNEPAIFFEYAYDTAKLAHSKGIKNIFVSNGYESEEALNLIKPYLDAMNIDIKSFNDAFYKKLCRARLQPVLETVKKAHEMGIWVEITTLVIPGHNDSDEELKKIAEFIVKIDKCMPWHISAFYPHYKMADVNPTSHDALIRAYDIGKRAGLKYVYVGNVYDDKRSATYCPKCNELLISRQGYDAEIKNLKNGKCSKCNEKIAGVWK